MTIGDSKDDDDDDEPDVKVRRVVAGNERGENGEVGSVTVKDKGYGYESHVGASVTVKKDADVEEVVSGKGVTITYPSDVSTGKDGKETLTYSSKNVATLELEEKQAAPIKVMIGKNVVLMPDQNNDGKLMGYIIDAATGKATTKPATVTLADTAAFVFPTLFNGDFVYCLNYKKPWPDQDGTYYTTESNVGLTDAQKEQIAAILAYGYPLDSAGILANSDLTDLEKYSATQWAIWAITEEIPAELLFDEKTKELLEKSKEGIADIQGTLSSATGDTAFAWRNGRYETGMITISGDYNGTFSLNLPDGVEIYGESGKLDPSSLKANTSFYLVSANNPGSFSLEAIYYHLGEFTTYEEATEKGFQPLGGLTLENNSLGLSFTTIPPTIPDDRDDDPGDDDPRIPLNPPQEEQIPLGTPEASGTAIPLGVPMTGGMDYTGWALVSLTSLLLGLAILFTATRAKRRGQR